MNRKRVIEELQSKNFMIRSSGERMALNTPIQGTAADILKKAMVEIFEEFTKRGLKSKMLIQVHDELVFNVLLDEMEEVEVSEAELEVMQVLWEKGESTSLEIISEVKKKKEWKNNTIKTLISRLVTKEFIDVIRKDKSLLVYKSKVSEEDYKSKETSNFIEKLYNGSINNMLVAFAKSKKLSKKDLEDLIKLVGDEEDK